jgi:hypothetical protein
MITIKFTDVLRTSPKIKGAYIIHFKDKVYVGSSKNVLNRLNNHRCSIRSKTHRYSNDIGKYKECDIYFSIYPKIEITEKYKKLGIALNKQTGSKPTEETIKKRISSRKYAKDAKYTKVKVIRISEQQHKTLVKMKSYNVDVGRFIREAIADKINKEYSNLIPKAEKEVDSFSASLALALSNL